ncbi:MAG: RagB/SusD family nutrient uptake outer membrane protein [Bacteroidetes bacterium]|nr:RagB/SusD family nutrient uptake outer membrane protein [Bacteroidota bacterium]
MKKMIHKVKRSLVFAFLALVLILGSCTDYLNQAPEASVNEKDAFKDFISFQGFTEELYSCIVNPFTARGNSQYDMADELIGNQTWLLGKSMDEGNYWAWLNYNSFLGWFRGVVATSPTSGDSKAIWPLAWYGIRKANLGLANMDKLVNATQEEKDLIKGQLLFFRGYFYLDLMKNWGGLPYVDKVLSPTDKMKLPRLNYRETALKAAGDLEQAAQLLPLKWDGTEAGKRTLGNNRQRISKATAYAFLGKDLLYAASPLMNRESTGKAGYDVDLCKKAAEAFSKVIGLCNETGVYSLQPWSAYTDMFFTVSPDRIVPGGSEVMMNPPVYSFSSSTGLIFSVGALAYTNTQLGVTQNYVQNWGMANGLPITDPASGYNPADPWSNRDPRFYKTIVVDGNQIASTTAAGPNRFAQLYTNGIHRKVGSTLLNLTGYLTNKYWGITCNRFDNVLASTRYQYLPPLMRLSDVYLMYAEAVLQGYGTAQSSFPGSISAEAAVNKVRNRATVPNLDPKFTTSKDAFMGQIILERAVELSFEGLRWYDLRRWMLAGQTKYKVKTAIDFDRGPDGKPVNMKERVLTVRVFDEKHYWLPLPVDQVTLYPEFGQNPGW